MEVLFAIFTAAVCIIAIIEIIRVCIGSKRPANADAVTVKDYTAKDFHRIIYHLWMNSREADNKVGFIATINNKEFVVKYQVEHLTKHPNALLLCVSIDGEFVFSTLQIYNNCQHHYSLHIDRKYIKEEVYQIIKAASDAYFKNNDPANFKKSLLNSKEA